MVKEAIKEIMQDRWKNKLCEICNIDIKKIGHKHHIIPRVNSFSTNLKSNLAYICPNCHGKVHSGELIIEGVYMTTVGQKLFWHKAHEKYIIRPGIILDKNGIATIMEE